jgi:hypothetical protein
LYTASAEGIFHAFVETADFVAAISLFIDFKKCADEALRRQVFDGETDGLRGLGKSPVLESLTPGRAPSRWKQLGFGVVIELSHRSALH